MVAPQNYHLKQHRSHKAGPRRNRPTHESCAVRLPRRAWGNYNGYALWGADNHFDNDTTLMTVVSYFSPNKAGMGGSGVAITPMIADIAAMWELYGPPRSVGGGISDFGGQTANVVVSATSVIENVITGSGADRVLGNDVIVMDVDVVRDDLSAAKMPEGASSTEALYAGPLEMERETAQQVGPFDADAFDFI